GSDEAWREVLAVHLGGYLNVLGAALPLMAAVGRGSILGVTSGSGWRVADAGAYGCAKRAVAALTWRLGSETPAGVSVNAFAPVARTRMVLNSASRGPGMPTSGRWDSSSGGLSFDRMPPPERLGPVGAHLAGKAFAASSRGQVVFSN